MDEEIPWLSQAEEEAWRDLQLMQAQLTAELNRCLLADSELTYSDYAVLVTLGRRADQRMRSNQLGRELGWEKSRVSHQVTRMQSRGLVTRQDCPTDRRGAFVALTEGGRTSLARAAPGHVAAVRRHFIDRLTSDQVTTLGQVARSVLDSLAGDFGAFEDGPGSLPK